MAAISRHIEAMYGDLPAAHSTLLSHHLNRMKQTGDLVMYKNNYLRPDPTRTSRRGPGRPPKVRVLPVSGDVASAVLPVSGDVASPVLPVSGDGPSPTPKKRGRPVKSGASAGDVPQGPHGSGKGFDSMRKSVDSKAILVTARERNKPAKISDPEGSLRSHRPRGRPPKKTNSNAAKILSRSRGRPPKNSNSEAPLMLPRPRGRPPKKVISEKVVSENAVTLSRPRGRPQKKNVDVEGIVALPETNSLNLSGRKRGRPKKIEETGDEMIMTDVPASPSSGMKRGRGRPPKAKPIQVIDSVES